jgi:hypothetical protein
MFSKIKLGLVLLFILLQNKQCFQKQNEFYGRQNFCRP